MRSLAQLYRDQKGEGGVLAMVALTLVFLFPPFFPFLEQRPPQDLVHWRTVAEGEAESRATQRPMLYLFTADWCPPCGVLKTTMLSDTHVADLIERNFVPVEVEDVLDADLQSSPEVRELKFRFLVSRLPTFVVTHGHGGPAVSEEGLLVYTEMARFLKTAPARLAEAEKRYERGQRKRR